MASTFSSSRGSGVLLFDEDFDLPPPSPVPPPEPEIIEPLFTLVELQTARDEAAQESREAALAEAGASSIAVTSRAMAAIAEQIAAGRSEAVSAAEQSSEAIARLLLDCFAVAFPALSTRHGTAEAAAMLRHILPALHREPKITVRVNPHIIKAITREIELLDSDLAALVRLVPTDAVVPGDARVTWEHGSASRDAASLWSQIENILAPVGLLNMAGPPNTERTPKEHELVE